MGSFVYAGAAAWQAGKPAHGAYRLEVANGRWARLEAGLPDGVEVRSIAVQRGTPGTVYIGTQEGPYRSTDGGDSWHHLPLPGKERIVWSILIHPRDSRTLYVGTLGTTIYRSRDGGESWRELKVPVPQGLVRMSFPTRVVRLAIDPNNVDEIYAGLEVGGVVRSLDGGETWEGCNEGLLRFTEDPRFKSRIVSDTDTEGMMDSHALAISPARAGTVFLANRMGLFRSRDRGTTWEEMGIGRFSPLTYARDVKVSAHDPRTLYAALSVAAVSDAGSLYRSTDLGESWQRFDHDVSIESTLMIVAASEADPKQVYCASRRGQVFGTEDGGATWRQYRLPDDAEGIYALATA
ncbi:MAG TPA: hypothetical protein VMU42_13505 [Candidatus Sulfotelmatobacter sp.]|nr:hypothetical protein [Candidatus Sulfotelmatobacter sp.]